jgi:hypothetical protein
MDGRGAPVDDRCRRSAMDTTQGLLVLAFLAVFFAAVYPLGRNEVVRRRLRCPRSGVEADVEVVRRYGRPQKPVRVRSCSELADPHHVDCGQACLRQTA